MIYNAARVGKPIDQKSENFRGIFELNGNLKLVGLASVLIGLVTPVAATLPIIGGPSAIDIIEFGPFRVEVQRDAALTWSDGQGNVRLRMVDSGYAIKLHAAVTSDSEVVCLRQPELLVPNPEPSGAANWSGLIAFIEDRMDECGLREPDTRASVLAEAETARPHYADAANYWKSASKELFGQISRRCIREKVKGKPIDSRVICTDWSK